VRKLYLQNRNVYKYVGITNFMYFKEKIVKGRKYKYAVRSVRLPNGKVASLEKIYTGQSKKQLEAELYKREKKCYTDYMLKNFKPDHILNKNEFIKIEEIRVNYKKILKKLSKTSLKDLLDRFTANFTYESNALEGNSLTLKDVAMVMFENTTIKGKNLREIYETRNSRKLVEMIVKNKFSISHKDIIKMHKMLVKDIGVDTGYKKFPNEIVGRNIKTTLPEKVYEEMDSLIKWYAAEKKKIHPLKVSALFHGKFERIHPFEDGNGRVGRFLVNVILIENKYPPMIIRKSQRLAYLNALEKFDDSHQDTLARFILEKFKETYRKFFEVYVKYL